MTSNFSKGERERPDIVLKDRFIERSSKTAVTILWQLRGKLGRDAKE